jgi:hypothetical protein
VVSFLVLFKAETGLKNKLGQTVYHINTNAELDVAIESVASAKPRCVCVCVCVVCFMLYQ